MSKLLNDPFSFIILSLLAIGCIYTIYYQVRVRRSGIETNAEVTQIVEKEIAGRVSVRSIEYDIHVSYITEDGRRMEGILSNPNAPFTVGERIRIRYVRNHPELPVYVGKY